MLRQFTEMGDPGGKLVFERGGIVGTQTRKGSEHLRKVTETHPGGNRAQLGNRAAAPHQDEPFTAEGYAVDVFREVARDLGNRR